MSSSPARLFVIAAPSGAGKTTLVKSLLERNPGLRFSVSYTTREQRKTEIESRDYFFVNEERFLQLKAEKELLESALVFGNYYGTGRVQVQEHLAKGNHVILEIDWQGARQVRESMPDCVSIFILPPARPELERRLRDRGTDNDEVIAHRVIELEVPVLLLGFVLPGSNLHSPNEWMSLEMYHKGIDTITRLYDALADEYRK